MGWSDPDTVAPMDFLGTQWRGFLFVVLAIALLAAIVIPAFEPDPPNPAAIAAFDGRAAEGEVLVLVESARPLAEGLGDKVVVRTDALRCPDGSQRDEDAAYLGRPVTVELDPITVQPRDVLPILRGIVTLETC